MTIFFASVCQQSSKATPKPNDKAPILPTSSRPQIPAKAPKTPKVAIAPELVLMKGNETPEDIIQLLLSDAGSLQASMRSDMPW